MNKFGEPKLITMRQNESRLLDPGSYIIDCIPGNRSCFVRASVHSEFKCFAVMPSDNKVESRPCVSKNEKSLWQRFFQSISKVFTSIDIDG
jgi:hypothetical protein